MIALVIAPLRGIDRLRLVLILAAAVLVSGCVSTATAPAHLGPLFCRADPELVGTWRSYRMSQLGPGWMTFAFDCDCTYVATVRTVFIIHREKGRYWSQPGRLSFSRANGAVTTWPFTIEDGRLLLEESAGEVHAYRGTAKQCR
jgi:hypothetical protein